MYTLSSNVTQLANQDSAKRSAEDEEQDEGKDDEEGDMGEQENGRTPPPVVRVPNKQLKQHAENLNIRESEV